MHLVRLIAKGQLVRLGRGIYSLPDGRSTEHHSLAVVSKLLPVALSAFSLRSGSMN